jgi:mono/diheme cytochrome c family protein
MRLSRFVALLGAAFAIVAVSAARVPEHHSADPTFAEDVAPIFFKNCATCHRPGGIGPFSVLDYDSVTPKLGKMKGMVRSGRMPPWQAAGPRGVFRNDRRLTEAEKDVIVRWLESGAKPGDMTKLPAKPQFTDGWEIGAPDLVVSMPEEFTVPASGEVEYMYFEAPTNLTEEKWVQAIEIMPGARDVVHHVLIYARAPAPSAPQQAGGAPSPSNAPSARPQPLFVRNPAYAIPPDPPRRDSAHAPPRNRGVLIGSTAPGTNVVSFPEGTALRLRAGTILTFQMHYTSHGHEMKDRSSVGFRFAKEMPSEEIYAAAFTNGAFTIPAGARDVAIPSEITPTQPVKIWGLLPHTHLRGTRWLYKLDRPDSTSEVILDVPRYDFNWQTFYLFEKPLEIPAGVKLTSMAWYDNSPSNKDNPDPTKDVKWGDQTWEEMQYTGFLYSVPSRRLRP